MEAGETVTNPTRRTARRDSRKAATAAPAEVDRHSAAKIDYAASFILNRWKAASDMANPPDSAAVARERPLIREVPFLSRLRRIHSRFSRINSRFARLRELARNRLIQHPVSAAEWHDKAGIEEFPGNFPVEPGNRRLAVFFCRSFGGLRSSPSVRWC